MNEEYDASDENQKQDKVDEVVLLHGTASLETSRRQNGDAQGDQKSTVTELCRHCNTQTWIQKELTQGTSATVHSFIVMVFFVVRIIVVVVLVGNLNASLGPACCPPSPARRVF